MVKKDRWDKANIIFMCIFAGITAIATAKLAFYEVPELSKSLENLTISRGQCLTPNVIFGEIKYNGESISNAKVTITNINTGDKKELFTSTDGSYVESVGNFPNCWVGGDRINVFACANGECESEEVIFSFENGGIEVSINI